MRLQTLINYFYDIHGGAKLNFLFCLLSKEAGQLFAKKCCQASETCNFILMKYILSLVFAALLLGNIQAQVLDSYPKVGEAYSSDEFGKMIANGEFEELEMLEFFAKEGWAIAPEKEGNDYPALELMDGQAFDSANFNPLKYNLKAAEGAHQYYSLPNGEVLIIFSEERLNVLFARYQKLKGKN